MTIAIVTPWFGPDLSGGAERIAWQTANRLAARGHDVHVLTTCSKSFASNWGDNYHPPGSSSHHSLTVKRFRVRKRNADRFEQVNQKLLSSASLRPGVSPLSPEESAIFLQESINSDDLAAYLEQHGDSYQALHLLPYLYGTALNTWRTVAGRAFLQPCLHDEAYAYLPQVAEMMRGVRGILFNSEGERSLARELFGPGIESRAILLGAAVELSLDDSTQHAAIGGMMPESERFVLYLGRRAETKNVPFLCDVFRAYRERFPESALKLVLAGPGTTNYTDRNAGILDAGFISEDQKKRLLTACLALVQPSKNESYSRSMMEAWVCGRPVIVNGECAATSHAVELTGAGLFPKTDAEWIEAFHFIDTSEESVLCEIASRAQWYIEQFASWPAVLAHYEAALGIERAAGVEDGPGASTNGSVRLRAVHQVMDALDYADAISNQAIALRSALWDAGYHSEIFAARADGRMTHLISKEASPPDDAGLIVHTSSSTQSALSFQDHPNKKILMVHGAAQLDDRLVPAAAAYDAVYASAAEGLGDLQRRFSREIVPFTGMTDPARWNMDPDPTLMASLQDGKSNLLFVGSIQPKNAQHELLQVFAHYLTMDLNARLVLVGRFEFADTYYQELLHLVHGSALSQHVLITGLVSDPALAAVYATAHLYVTLSESEPLGGAIVDAMWFDVPVCAYRNSGTIRILDDSGILIREKSDLLGIAALCKVVATDADVRKTVLKSQERRLRAFDRHAMMRQAATLVAAMEPALANQHL